MIVSASHVVRSHAVIPDRKAEVNVPRPKLEPATVMLIDAVAAALARCAVLKILRSKEKPKVKLAEVNPEVKETRRLPKIA